MTGVAIYWLVIFFVLGTIIGSFLNVVIYRLHTGKSLGGRSHCLSCGSELRWFELFPLLSYIGLRASCRHCDAYIPPRYFVVELLTGVTFLYLWYIFSNDLILFVLYAVLAALIIVISVYDIRHTIIPDELTLGTLAVAVLYLGYTAYEIQSFDLILTNVLSGLSAGLFIGALWYLSQGRWMGLGDAKLAVPLGIIAGYPAVFSMVIFSFWIGAIIASLLLLIQALSKKGKTSLHNLLPPITMKSEVPFAPFLILGFIAVHFFHANIFDITFFFFFFGV